MAVGPTLIAGIYGMNFDNMPELHYHYGYYFVLGAMVLMSLLLWRFFKRKDWL
ncbi:CorA family divalent cation transporter [Corynebacterium kutscheri]|nr:CorA family divalent cation transporter [Corynebacterium kutscheri]